MTALIIDSGCGQSIFCEREFFESIDTTPSKQTRVFGFNLTSQTSSGVGVAVVRVRDPSTGRVRSIRVPDSLYFPQHGINLASVSQLRASGCGVVFPPSPSPTSPAPPPFMYTTDARVPAHSAVVLSKLYP